MKVIKERFTKLLHHGGIRTGPIWQKRFYDFNVSTSKKRIEKLRYMHRNPVKRGLAEKPEDWDWSSFRAYAFQQVALVGVNCQEWPLTISYSPSRAHSRNPRMSGAPGRRRLRCCSRDTDLACSINAPFLDPFDLLTSSNSA
jgi:hypothetical protein